MNVLTGSEVAASMADGIAADVEKLKRAGITPRLAIVRVGDNPADVAYERGAAKRLSALGIGVEPCTLSANADQVGLQSELRELANDSDIHGILLMRPLPANLDEDAAVQCILPSKDVDGSGALNIAKVFAGDPEGFAPCTAEGVMRLLDHYGIELAGKRVVVVGRSLVVGRPLAMLLLARNATVTICHSGTKDLAKECQRADVLISAMGHAGMIDAEYVAPGAVVIDVGMNLDEEGHLCGDVDQDSVAAVASALTPVPRGVGAVTTSVLASHVTKAALGGVR